MDWEKYAKELEKILDAIDLPESTRILVEALIEEKKQECQLDS
jgi:hypothetical protein